MIEIWRTEKGSDQQSQTAYDDIYSGKGIRVTDSLYLWALRLLQPRPGARLLDVSCGEGSLVAFARRQRLAACGVDFSAAAIRRARRLSGSPTFGVADGGQLPFGGGIFDYVTCIGSLEHYVEPLAGMRDICRVLRPGGAACILVPNTFSLLGNVDYARKTGEIFDDGQPIQRYNTRAGWQRMLEQSGLEVTAVHKWEMQWPLTWADRLWYARRPVKLAHLLVSLCIPTNLANSLVYLCRRGS